MDLFNLIAKITLDDKNYKKGINSAEKSGKSFGKTLTSGLKVAGKAMAALYTGTVAVAAAIAKVTLGAINNGDEIDKQSQKLNMSSAGYQKWATMLEMGGTSIDKMSSGMEKFAGILDDASNGNADALLTLNKLGLGFEDFEGLSVEDSLKKVVEQFQSMEAGAKKTKLAVDIFGSAGQELLPILNQEKGSIDKLFQSYEDLGLIKSEEMVKASAELSDMITLLKKKFTALKDNLGFLFYPMLKKIIAGMTELANGSFSGMNLISEGVTDMITKVISYLPKIGEFAGKIIPLIVDTVISTLPSLVDGAIQIVVSLADMLIEYLPELIPAAIGMILTLVQGLIDNLPSLIDTAIDLILAIVEGLINSLPIIIEMAPDIIISLVDGIVGALPKLIDAAVDIIFALVDYLADPDNIDEIISAAVTIIGALATGLIDNVSTILDKVPEIFTKLKNKFKEIDWAEIGKNIIKGIANGLTKMGSFVTDKIKEAGSSIANGFKNFFGIQSPSRLFRDEVGKYIPQGIAVGVENEMPDTANRIKKSIKDNTDVDDMVNGFNTVSRMRANNAQPIQLTVPVYVGNEELKTYTYKAVDSGMKQRGLRDLKTTGGYNT